MTPLDSLQGRVTVALLLTLGGLWAGAVTHARHRAAEDAVTEMDARLEAAAVQLFEVRLHEDDVGPPPTEPATPVPAPLDRRGMDRRPERSRLPSFEIAWDDGRAPTRSADFPRDIGPTRVGVEERAAGDRTWRVLTVVYRSRGMTGRVALDDLARASLVLERNRDVVRPLLWIFPLLVAATLVSIRAGLAPLRRLERALEAQEPFDLGPLELGGRRLPRELEALRGVIDRLLGRLRDVLDRQRRFTSAAAHELRTPLAGCRVQLQVAERSPDEATRERALGQARRALDAMDRLVDQLLALARVDLGLADVPKRHVDLALLAAEASAAHERIAETAGVALRATGGPSGAVVLGNATLLRSMIGNLVDNAIKFSPRRGTVDVSVAVRGARAEVRVRDRGPGVPAVERERAFEPFRRGEDDRRRGSGLGLTTVRAIARAHGGEARLDASPEGGTDAVIDLPVADAARAP